MAVHTYACTRKLGESKYPSTGVRAHSWAKYRRERSYYAQLCFEGMSQNSASGLVTPGRLSHRRELVSFFDLRQSACIDNEYNS